MFAHFPWSCFPSMLSATRLLLPVLLSVEMAAWQKKLDSNNQSPRASDGEDDSEDEDDQTEPVVASTHLDSGASICLDFAYLCTSFSCTSDVSFISSVSRCVYESALCFGTGSPLVDDGSKDGILTIGLVGKCHGRLTRH